MTDQNIVIVQRPLPPKIIKVAGGAGGSGESGITLVTSEDDSVTIDHPAGPTVDLSVPSGAGWDFTGDGSPKGAVSATEIGQTYKDTTNGGGYIAIATGTSGWVLMGGAAQGDLGGAGVQGTLGLLLSADGVNALVVDNDVSGLRAGWTNGPFGIVGTNVFLYAGAGNPNAYDFTGLRAPQQGDYFFQGPDAKGVWGFDGTTWALLTSGLSGHAVRISNVNGVPDDITYRLPSGGGVTVPLIGRTTFAQGGWSVGPFIDAATAIKWPSVQSTDWSAIVDAPIDLDIAITLSNADGTEGGVWQATSLSVDPDANVTLAESDFAVVELIGADLSTTSDGIVSAGGATYWGHISCDIFWSSLV